jgi:hypothetical protein
LTERVRQSSIKPWASTNADWRISAGLAEKEVAGRRATDAQVLEDAERLITAWNERQAKHMPMLFSPTIGAAITAGYWFLWVRCPACTMPSTCARLTVTATRP